MEINIAFLRFIWLQNLTVFRLETGKSYELGSFWAGNKVREGFKGQNKPRVKWESEVHLKIIINSVRIQHEIAKFRVMRNEAGDKNRNWINTLEFHTKEFGIHPSKRLKGLKSRKKCSQIYTFKDCFKEQRESCTVVPLKKPQRISILEDSEKRSLCQRLSKRNQKDKEKYQHIICCIQKLRFQGGSFWTSRMLL